MSLLKRAIVFVLTGAVRDDTLLALVESGHAVLVYAVLADP